MKKKPSEYETIRHKLESDMLQNSGLRIEIERRGFVNRTFTALHKAYQEKRVSHSEYVRLINRLAAYAQGEFNDYIDTLAGAAQLGMLELAIQGELSQTTPEASRQRQKLINEMTGTRPVQPEPPDEGKK